MSALERDRGPGASLPSIRMRLTVLVLAALFLTVSQAEARRRYFRQTFAAPPAAMAIDLNTGQILYSKNANELRYPASLTKVMTLYLLFDALRDGKLTMRSELTVSANAAAQSPTKLGLAEGDKISVADAIGAVVTKSANDMAVTIAEALAGSEEEFARRMTQKARTIGMLNTTFRNASGLPDPDQKTTAQDLIILGKNILADHPERCKIFAIKYFRYGRQIFQNHNTMLFSYQGMEGMKTGYTSASGFNLIATARRGNKRLLAVVLGGQSAGARNIAMRSILDSSWAKAVTSIAAHKSGPQVASIAPVPIEHARKQETPEPEKEATKPAETATALKNVGKFNRLKRRPDRTSASMVVASIELGLGSKYPRGAAVNEAAGDNTTDELDDRAEPPSLPSSPSTPSPSEIAPNETLVAQAAHANNVSVHYKTGGQPDVVPLDAASIDGVPEVQAVKPEQVVRSVEKEEAKQPPTLAAATVATSNELDHPGPFHVQVGAYADQEEAKQRLESVKQALGPDVMKAHPEFIMPVSLPTGVTMFRARLSRFNEMQAKSMCKRLKSSGFDCWDIRAQ